MKKLIYHKKERSLYQSWLEIFFISFMVLSIFIIPAQAYGSAKNHIQNNRPGIYFTLGKKFYKYNMYNASIWFLEKSKANLSRKYYGEYHGLLYQSYLNVYAANNEKLVEYLTKAHDHLIHSKRYNFYTETEYYKKEIQIGLLESELMLQLIRSDKKNNSLIGKINKIERIEFQLVALLYKVNVQDKYYNESFLSSCEQYAIQSNLVLIDNLKSDIDELLKMSMMNIFRTNHKILVNHTAIFEKYCHEEISSISKQYQENLSILDSSFSKTEEEKIVEFYSRIALIDYKLVPENHLNNFYRHHIKYISQRNSDNSIDLNMINSLINSSKTYKNFIYDHLYQNNHFLKSILSDNRFYNDRDIYPHITTALIRVQDSLLNNAVKIKDYSKATEMLLGLAILEPDKNRDEHLNWFVDHFDSLINNDKTTNMGSEMMLASHIYAKDLKLQNLRKKYIIKDFQLSYMQSDLGDVEVVWNGSVANCNPGTMPKIYYDKFKLRIQYFRRITGINDSITFNDNYNKNAQAAALIMCANRYLTHDPKPRAKCYSADGATGAGTGNLCSKSNTYSIDLYLSDQHVPAVGHRRWIIYPINTHFGVGSTSFTNCLVVITNEHEDYLIPYYSIYPVSWPMNGYFPLEHAENIAWSFSLMHADFSNSEVIIKQGNRKLNINMEPYKSNYGAPTISWQIISEIKQDEPVSVEIQKVKNYTGEYINYKYQVKLFSINEEMGKALAIDR